MAVGGLVAVRYGNGTGGPGNTSFGILLNGAEI
jgi:hypothetical protein